jgi:hypothetical protein
LLCLASTVAPAWAQSEESRTILEESAQAMGGLNALRGLTNQVVEVSGQQFEPEQGLRPGGEARHVADFRYTLIREMAAPRMRLEWNATTFYPRDGAVQFLEIIDGEYGLLQETSDENASSSATRLHPGRQASRLREERRAAVTIVLNALGNASLTRLPDSEVEGSAQHVLSFESEGEEFRVYLDVQTKLPTQVDILEHDTIYGDSRFTLRYADWKPVDGIMVPFELRYEINGILLQSERVMSVRHNIELAPDIFLVPDVIRRQEIDAEPIASQWILRRLAMNVSYLDFGRNIDPVFVPLCPASALMEQLEGFA